MKKLALLLAVAVCLHAAEVKKSANDHKETTEKKKGAAEIAERVHREIVNQED